MIRLEDEEISKIIDRAERNYRRHYYSARGQTITMADDLNFHIVLATVDYLEKQGYLNDE